MRPAGPRSTRCPLLLCPPPWQAILTGLKLAGRLDASKAGQRLWSGWQQLLGLAGLAGVPQVLWATFNPGSTTLLPCTLTLAAGVAVAAAEAAGRLPPAARGLWAAASAWTATALFMLQPVSQLVVNFTVRPPGGLAAGLRASACLAGHLAGSTPRCAPLPTRVAPARPCPARPCRTRRACRACR